MLKVLEGHTGSVNAVGIFGGKIVSGSMDNTLRVWNDETGQVISLFDLRLSAWAIVCCLLSIKRVRRVSPLVEAETCQIDALIGFVCCGSRC